jgi:hypothetical protein
MRAAERAIIWQVKSCGKVREDKLQQLSLCLGMKRDEDLERYEGERKDAADEM